MLSHLAAPASALGALLAYGRLLEGGELDAMRAAGISTASVVARLLPIPLLLALAMVPTVTIWAPAGLARYEGACLDRGGPPEEGGGWRREGRWITRRGGAEELFLQRGPGSEATAWVEIAGGEEHRWSADAGWHEGGEEGPPPFSGREVEVPAPGAFGLVGGGLTSQRLAEAITAASRAGLDTAALRAQLALRPTLASGAFLVPLLALLLAARLRIERPVRLVALGLVGCVLYWATLSVAWNAVGSGILADGWLWPGVPSFWAAVLVAVALFGGIEKKEGVTRR